MVLSYVVNPTHLALKEVESNYYKRSICTYTHGPGLTQSPHTEWTFHMGVCATTAAVGLTCYIQMFSCSAVENSF